MKKIRHAGGYSIFELMFALTILAILAAVAYPTIARARGASIEVSTVASLRTILAAQAVYAATCGQGFYAPSMRWLAQSGGSGRPAFIGPEFDGDIVDRSGYRIRFTPGARAAIAPRTCNGLGAGQAVMDYFVAADPLETAGYPSHVRHFGTNPGGIVFESSKRVRLVYAGPPPPPAKPIK